MQRLRQLRALGPPPDAEDEGAQADAQPPDAEPALGPALASEVVSAALELPDAECGGSDDEHASAWGAAPHVDLSALLAGDARITAALDAWAEGDAGALLLDPQLDAGADGLADDAALDAWMHELELDPRAGHAVPHA